jgi:hypothetical protein
VNSLRSSKIKWGGPGRIHGRIQTFRSEEGIQKKVRNEKCYRAWRRNIFPVPIGGVVASAPGDWISGKDVK